MLKSLQEEYDKVLERLEKANWTTKQMVFKVLAIEDKKVLDKLAKMEEQQLKTTLKMNLEEIINKQK